MFFVRLYVRLLSRSLTYSIDQSFILLMMMRSLVGNDIESKRWEFTLSQNHFRPYFYIVMTTSSILCSLLMLLARLFIAMLTMLTHEHTRISAQNSHFFASVRKKRTNRETRRNFLSFFIFFRSAVCFLEFLIFLSFNNNNVLLSQTSTASQIYIYIAVIIVIC